MRSEIGCGESILARFGAEGSCGGHQPVRNSLTGDAGAFELAAMPERALPEAPAGRPAPRALVVASRGRLRRLACRRLTAAGFDVRTTDDGLYALMLAHRNPPELIVIAREIAGLAAPEFLRRLGCDGRTRDVPVLAFELDSVGGPRPMHDRTALRGEWSR
ncbi:MAG: hypothetical protein HRF50_00480 [Phycisphaerae bacterium]|jgi:hypothetical protein